MNASYDVRLNKLMYCFDWAVLFGCDDNDKLIKSKLGAEADITYKKLLFFFRYRVQCRPKQMLDPLPQNRPFPARIPNY